MFNGRRVGVVIPAHNEERQIEAVLESVPDFVDRVFVIDDCSRDSTAELVSRWVKRLESRVDLIQHHKRSGVGAAVKSGYRAALDSGMELVAVVAGDGQMDPQDLHLLLEPVSTGRAAYSKGNRLASGVAWQKTPRMQYLGNALLSLLTKISSGYWHIADTQSGYTAISAAALRAITIDDLDRSYGYLNDLLIRLNVQSLPVTDVPTTPRYGIGERGAAPAWKFVPIVWFLLVRGFFFRMFEKYVVRDFHPIVLIYGLGGLIGLLGIVLGVRELIARLSQAATSSTAMVLVALLLISGVQLVLVAMWFDMEYNKDLS